MKTNRRPTGDRPAKMSFRPTARRRNRLIAGVALGAAAIGGNVLVYSSLDSGEPVVQVVRDIPAGELITADMLRTVEVDADDSVNVVPGSELESLIGHYARVRIVSGSLIVRTALQLDPLVTDGHAVVALEVKQSELPIGLRERVPVRLVVAVGQNAADQAPLTVEGRLVGLPRDSESGLGTQSISVEVDDRDAAIVAAADDVRVVLLVPEIDTASSTATSSETTSSETESSE